MFRRSLLNALFAIAATALGCTGSTSTATSNANGEGAEASSGETGSDGSGAENPPNGEAEVSRHPALAPLRPAGSEAVLVTLAESPGPREHAAAAAFYAGTDAAGMSLFWGLTAAALNFDHAWRAQVAASMKQVLQERVVVAEGGASISTRLAPGATPGLQQPDGRLLAPMAHLFESVIGAAVAPVAVSGQIQDGWTARALGSLLDAYQQVSAQGTPYDSVAPLHRWLAELKEAGHLRGFALHAFDVASADDAAAIDNAREWVRSHPLALEAATMPDDLVSLSM